MEKDKDQPSSTFVIRRLLYLTSSTLSTNVKKSKLHFPVVSSLLAGLFLAPATLLSQSFIPRVADGLWSDPSGWQGSVVPGALDTAIIRDGFTVDLDVNATVAQLSVSTTDTVGTLNLNTPGTTLSTGAFALGNPTHNTPGAINISAGTLDFNDPAGFGDNSSITIRDNFQINLNGGTFQTAGHTTFALTGGGVFNMTSGNFDFQGTRMRVNNSMQVRVEGGTFNLDGDIQLAFAGTGEFLVVGDQATINAGRINNQGRTGATWRFNLNETGISAIDGSGGSFMNVSENNLIVDGSAYTGGAANFALFLRPSSFQGFLTDDVEIIGFNPDWDVSVVNTADQIQLQIIPEPATVGMLLGGFMLGLVVFLRFRRTRS